MFAFIRIILYDLARGSFMVRYVIHFVVVFNGVEVVVQWRAKSDVPSIVDRHL